jgi:hypothetical protein
VGRRGQPTRFQRHASPQPVPAAAELGGGDAPDADAGAPPGWLEVPFALRRGAVAVLRIPADLTESESQALAGRICGYLGQANSSREG